jgi:hypothetical protein
MRRNVNYAPRYCGLTEIANDVNTTREDIKVQPKQETVVPSTAEEQRVKEM